jgi:predicted SnoaL-like aldol condensation-catalyzing enzyme
MKYSSAQLCAALVGTTLGVLCVPEIHAAKLEPAAIVKGDTGPLTPYGETPAEAAAKRTLFLWVYTSMVERNPRAAFENYVSKEYCNHSHLGTRGLKACSNYQETLEHWLKNYGAAVPPGKKIEYPALATVNGEMVTMYGAGVDIFRVRNGKITDHWDASPPAQISIQAHMPGFTEWVLGPRPGPPPMPPRDADSGVLLDYHMLAKIDVGAPTPYGETAAEAAAKRLIFEWVHLDMIEGQTAQAYAKFVARNYCDHSHMLNRAQKLCGSYDEAVNLFSSMNKPHAAGDRIEIPNLASVNGEMVTMYGAGVDIFRVKDGKITDHWDASPPAAVTIAAHAPGFAQWVMGDRKEPPPMLKAEE